MPGHESQRLVFYGLDDGGAAALRRQADWYCFNPSGAPPPGPDHGCGTTVEVFPCSNRTMAMGHYPFPSRGCVRPGQPAVTAGPGVQRLANSTVIITCACPTQYYNNDIQRHVCTYNSLTPIDCCQHAHAVSTLLAYACAVHAMLVLPLYYKCIWTSGNRRFPRNPLFDAFNSTQRSYGNLSYGLEA